MPDFFLFLKKIVNFSKNLFRNILKFLSPNSIFFSCSKEPALQPGPRERIVDFFFFLSKTLRISAIFFSLPKLAYRNILYPLCKQVCVSSLNDGPLQAAPNSPNEIITKQAIFSTSFFTVTSQKPRKIPGILSLSQSDNLSRDRLRERREASNSA